MTFAYGLSRWQVFVLVALTSICVTPFGFPDVYQAFGRRIWVALLLQAGVTLAGGALALGLARRLPADRSPNPPGGAFGPWLGRAYWLLLGIFLLAWGPVGNLDTVLQLAEVTELPETSPTYPALLVLALAVYLAWFGPEVVARFAEAFTPFLLAGLAVILVVPLFQADFASVLPLDLPPPDAFGRGATWAFALGIRGFFLVPLLAWYLRDRDDLGWPVLGGLGAALVVVGTMSLSPYFLFGEETVRTFQFPPLEVMATPVVTVLPVESFLFLTLTIWHAVGFVVVAATLYAAAGILAGTFGMVNHRWLVVPLALAAFAAVRLPMDPPLRDLIRLGWSAIGYVVGFLLPAVILLVVRPAREDRP